MQSSLKNYENQKILAKCVKAAVLIVLMLAGYKLAGSLLLHINFGVRSLDSTQAFVITMGSKMLQLIYVLFILCRCGWAGSLKPDKKRLVRGLQKSVPLLFVYALMSASVTAWQLIYGMPQSTGLDSKSSVTAVYVAQKFIYYFAGVAATEEILFRGIIMRKLYFLNKLGKRHWNRAVIVQAVIFGLMHGWQLISVGNTAAAAGSMVCAAAGGAVYGGIYARSKSLWVVIMLHGLYDFVIFFV